jgi:O-antigen/teichoic acid export membrane protein
MQEPKNQTTKEHADLYKRSIKGGYWVVAIRGTTQLLEFFKFWIVYNLLFHENLELIFVANILMTGLMAFSESGFHAALVQKKENIEDYLDTAWVIGILRGIILFIAVYFAADLFASYKYKAEPEKIALAISVIRVMGICFLIRAFQNIGTIYFQKEMEFHKTFWLRMAGTLSDIVLSISLVLIYKSVWAYVIARLITSVVNVTVSYLLCSYRPKFHFVPEKARELWKFGKWLFAGNSVGYLLSEGDNLFVLFYFADSLPFKLYRGAYRFALMPATYITNTISQVSFPAYSKIQRDIPRLREAYLKVLQATAMIAIPVVLLIFALGPDFVRLFLANIEESHVMVLLIQLLAFKGFMASVSATYGPIFKSLGKPQISLYISLLSITIFATVIYPFTKLWGIYGTALATIFFGALLNPLCIFIMSRLLCCSVWKMLQRILFPLVASILMAVVLVSVRVLFPEKPTYLSFFTLGIIGVAAYLSFIGLLDRLFKCGMRQLLFELINTIKQKTGN